MGTITSSSERSLKKAKASKKMRKPRVKCSLLLDAIFLLSSLSSLSSGIVLDISIQFVSCQLLHLMQLVCIMQLFMRAPTSIGSVNLVNHFQHLGCSFRQG